MEFIQILDYTIYNLYLNKYTLLEIDPHDFSKGYVLYMSMYLYYERVEGRSHDQVPYTSHLADVTSSFCWGQLSVSSCVHPPSWFMFPLTFECGAKLAQRVIEQTGDYTHICMLPNMSAHASLLTCRGHPHRCLRTATLHHFPLVLKLFCELFLFFFFYFDYKKYKCYYCRRCIMIFFKLNYIKFI